MRQRFVPLLHQSAVSSSAGAPTVRVSTTERFLGCDLGRAPTGVDHSRSPDAKNMIRDEIGQVRKRMGYRKTKEYDMRINGAFSFDGETFIHAGVTLYHGDTAIGAMADRLSSGWVLGGKLYLLDGSVLRVLEKNDGAYRLSYVENQAYVPTVVISRDPTGGGTAYEDYNLLGAGFTNSFYGVASRTVYQMTDDELDETTVTAYVLNSYGTWVQKYEGVDFSVNRTTGTVTFKTAPGASPVLGEDNVRITASKTRLEYVKRIDHCNISTLYGVNGAADRLFVTGNPDYPNIDWYSAQNDPSMFGDTCYSLLGQDDSAITGYSIVSNHIAAHKDHAEDGRNVILRAGSLSDDGEAEFRIVTTLIGDGDIAPRAHAYLRDEPLFLTARGVFAITSADVTGEKYSQSRSAFLNACLTAEENMSDAAAIVWNDFYLLFLNERVYVLDGLQKTYLRDEPYSLFQYEGYVLDHIPARVVWQSDGKLCFGTEDGEVMEFYTDKDDPDSYNDNGAPIEAYWDTPYYLGQVRHNRKRFSYLSLTLAAYPTTSVTVWAKKVGSWKQLFSEAVTADTDLSPRCVRRPIDIGLVDKTMFRLENKALGEPFALYDLTTEYIELGKF
jgi:hypothetical protein